VETIWNRLGTEGTTTWKCERTLKGVASMTSPPTTITT